MRQGKVIIIGLGDTGTSVARYLAQQQQAFVCLDTRANPPNLNAFQQAFPQAEVYTQDWPQALLDQAQQIILSPGVDPRHPWIESARQMGIEIIGDVELFARHNSAPVIAITGSNGKTTVTSLVGEMAKACFDAVAVIGNIGEPVLNTLIDKTPIGFVVMELSSFQLETATSLNPLVAIVLNISPDHLDRYNTYQDYIAAKHRIFAGAKHVVINRDDPLSTSTTISSTSQRHYFTCAAPQSGEFGLKQIQGETWLCFGDEPWIKQTDLKIRGLHNTSNALSALAIGHAAGFAKETMLNTLRTFTGLHHRCELVTEHQGIQWINDSKGTNIGATTAALEGIGQQLPGKIVLLLGGDGKGADFKALIPNIAQFCRAVLVTGKDAQLIASALDNTIQTQFVQDMQSAVKLAQQVAQQGDCVLLSPACASTDQYRNYIHRGEVFTSTVKTFVG